MRFYLTAGLLLLTLICTLAACQSQPAANNTTGTTNTTNTTNQTVSQEQRAARKISRDEAKNIAQKLHDQLDQLEVAGEQEKMLDYLTDDMVRMDANRPLAKGRQSWNELFGQMRSRQIKVESVKHNVLDSWQSEDRIYEYGTVDSKVRFQNSPAAAIEALNYFAVLRADSANSSNYKVEFYIRNTAQPVEQLNQLAK